MKRLKDSCFAQILSIFALALFIMPVNAGLVNAAMSPTTKVTHKPISYFVPGSRITLETTVKDDKGINTVRCYFKAKGEANYVFVTMTGSGGAYQGILPAPSKTTEELEYLFLVVNNEKQIVKTQPYMVKKKDTDKVPAWQFGGQGNITVSTELAKAPAELAGFTDSVVVDAVESAARFGAVAGLYNVATSSSSAAGAAGTSTSATTATGATMAGTVTAGAAGISTAALIGAAAVIGGGAAAIGSSGGGGGSHGEVLTEGTIVGYWNITGSNAAAGSTTAGNITFNDNGSYTYVLNSTFSDGSTNSSSGGGQWTLTGTNLDLTFDAGAVYDGTASGNSNSFTMVSSNGWTLNFTR
ncbi:MAG: lipocalin family protein [Pseudomonadota bacterium]